MAARCTGQPTREQLQMKHFELIDSDLAVDAFRHETVVQHAESDAAGVGQVAQIEAERLKRQSRRFQDAEIYQRLSIPGIAFISALEELTDADLVDLKFADILADQVIFDSFATSEPDLTKVHLVCETSDNAFVRAADERMPLRAGDLWKSSNTRQPSVYFGGDAGLLVLILTLRARVRGSTASSHSHLKILEAAHLARSGV